MRVLDSDLYYPADNTNNKHIVKFIALVEPPGWAMQVTRVVYTDWVKEVVGYIGPRHTQHTSAHQPHFT